MRRNAYGSRPWPAKSFGNQHRIERICFFESGDSGRFGHAVRSRRFAFRTGSSAASRSRYDCRRRASRRRDRAPEVDHQDVAAGAICRRFERLDPDQLALAVEEIDSDLAREEEKRPTGEQQAGERPSRRKPLPAICRAKRSGSTSRARTAAAAAARCMSSERASARCWIGFRLSCASSAPRVPNTPVGLARRWRRRRRRNGRSPAAWRRLRCSPRCWSASIAITRPCIGRRKSSPATGSIFQRSTLAGWVGGACWWLEALHERLARNVFASDRLLADDTPVPVLDPGRGRTKTGRLWVYAREQRAWGGPEPPAAVYLCAPDRKAERPASHLERFSGVLHVDGYAGFEPLAQKGDVVLAAYWSHTRRKFYDVAQATNAPIAAEALRRTAHFMPSNPTLTVGRLHSGLRLVTVAPSQSSTLCTPGSSRSLRCCRNRALSPRRSGTR